MPLASDAFHELCNMALMIPAFQCCPGIKWDNDSELQSTHSRISGSERSFPLRSWEAEAINQQGRFCVFFVGHKDDPNLFAACFVFLQGLSGDVCNGQRLDAQALFVPEGLCEQFTVEAGPRPWVSHVSLRIPILQ